MSGRITAVAAISLGALAIVLSACSSGKDKPASREQASQTGSSMLSSSGSVAGLIWSVPSRWSQGPEQQMRSATYVIKAVEGDRDDAECAVYYFGSGMGGDKESNLQRWENQFEQADGRNSADMAVIKEMETGGIKVTTIDLAGIYRLSAGPMMEVKEKKLGYRLLGAIVEGPQGLVFFKMVGPERTVAASHDDFMRLVNSIRAQGA